MDRPALPARVLAPLRRIRRRMRVQAAFDGAARASVPAAALGLVAVYLWRLEVVGHAWLARGAIAVGVVVAIGAIAGAARRIPLARVAKRADVSHALDDRLGSALAFLDERAPTPFMLAAVDDAAARAPSVSPKRAAPLSRPRGLGMAALVACVAGVMALLRFPERAHVLAPPPPAAPRLAVDHDLLEPEREAAAELAREAAESDDPEAKKLADEMKQLLDQLDREELTRKQVFDKLAEIEKQLKPQDGNFDELKRALQKAGTELGKEKLTRETGQALVKEDLAKAKQELEKLAAEAERLDKAKKPDEKKRDELARSLKRAAEAQPEKSAEQKKQEQEEQRLKEEQRRLQKQLAERPNDRELQRRLQRNQRELERLEREKQQRAEQQRQLQRLQRELQQAAEQLRQKLSPEAAEALRRAAQQLGQMENEIRKLGNMSKAQVQIAELKEMLRRARSIQPGQGQPQDGQGDQQANGRGQRPGQSGGSGGQQSGQQNGKGQGKSLLRDFNNRAGGEKTLILGAGGDTPVLLPLPMGAGDKPGPQGQGGQGEQLPGDGIGSEHDPNLMGDATKLASKRHDTRVQGKDAAGPSRSETILGSAERGFSTRAYRRVYSDYTSVMEEVMSKERVPPGYRFYIKRYFQLIKPRD